MTFIKEHILSGIIAFLTFFSVLIFYIIGFILETNFLFLLVSSISFTVLVIRLSFKIIDLIWE